jgi:hypothetical protein
MFRAPSEVCQKIFCQRKNAAKAKKCPKLGKITVCSKKFVFMPQQYKMMLLSGFRSDSSPSLLFSKYCPFKYCKEKKIAPSVQISYGTVDKCAEWNIVHADNKQN